MGSKSRFRDDEQTQMPLGSLLKLRHFETPFLAAQDAPHHFRVTHFKRNFSCCYQSRSVRFVDISNHQGLQEASGGSTEFGKGDRAPLASARIGALECRSGLSRL